MPLFTREDDGRIRIHTDAPGERATSTVVTEDELRAALADAGLVSPTVELSGSLEPPSESSGG